MNVFEDLIVELQEENLLEKTVMESYDEQVAVQEASVEHDEARSNSFAMVGGQDEFVGHVSEERDPAPSSEAPGSAVENESDSEDEQGSLAVNEKPSNGSDFYKKRAVSEISSLQMVEHVLTGVEREYLKIVPRSFDDFNAKKALNNFLHVVENENSAEHAEAEFAMMQETEAWCTALAERDLAISVANLRHYCENSRPALSSLALVALARFYRNLPYSEEVRAKFDFTITRLFSRSTGHCHRTALFSREETFNHIKMLYKEWSSIPLYAAEDDDASVMLTALSFEDLATESENASSFDSLISSDFFTRLRTFKESVNEMYFAPTVVAAAIDCNIRVGNAYVDLLDREHEKMAADGSLPHFPDLDEDEIANTTGKTLGVAEILRRRRAAEAADAAELHANASEAESPRTESDANWTIKERRAARRDQKNTEKASPEPGARSLKTIVKEQFTTVNRWVLIGAVIAVIGCAAIFVWSNFAAASDARSPNVAAVDLESPVAREFVANGKISGQNFYGIVQPAWDGLPKERRLEVLKIVFDAAKKKGAAQVTLLSSKGKPAAFASDARQEVGMP